MGSLLRSSWHQWDFWASLPKDGGKQIQVSKSLILRLTWPMSMAKLFQLLGITYFVENISRSNFYFRAPFAK